jgi:cell wall-associated NlpC family hydrolase
MINNIQGLNKFIGIDYVLNGRTFDGADCWGLLYLYHGESFPSFSNVYNDAEEVEKVSKKVHYEQSTSKFLKIPEQEVQKGDIIFFNIMGLPVHVGIALNNHEMLHTLRGQNSSIENYKSRKWNNRIQGIYRWVKS